MTHDEVPAVPDADEAEAGDAAGGWTIESKVHFGSGRTGARRLREGAAPAPQPDVVGRVPRVARVLALAHRLEGLVRSGAVRDYADLARVAGVTRVRITQITGLLMLAPDIQEAVLDLPRTVAGRDRVRERDLRAVAAEPVWEGQRAAWRRLRGHPQ